MLFTIFLIGEAILAIIGWGFLAYKTYRWVAHWINKKFSY